MGGDGLVVTKNKRERRQLFLKRKSYVRARNPAEHVDDTDNSASLLLVKNTNNTLCNL